MNHSRTRLRWAGVLILALGVLVSCARTEDPMTTVPRTWRIPGYKNMVYKDVMVLAVVRSEEVRKALEDAFVADLSSEWTRARSSWQVLPEHKDLTEDALEAALKTGDIAGALTEVEALPEAAAPALEGWAEQARVRQAALEASAALAQELNAK